jgi:hypothetical protein
VKDPGKPGLPPGGGAKLFAAALVFIAGVVVPIYAFASRSSAVDDNARTAVTIFGIAFLLIFLSLTYGLVRTVFPPKASHLKVEVDRRELRRGEDVVVRLEVTRDPKPDDKLELGLVCTEFYDEKKSDGRGGSTRGTSEAKAFEDWRPQTSAQPMHEVRFAIPADGPYSYRGDCVSFVWRVSAREPKRLRFDRATNLQIVVRP